MDKSVCNWKLKCNKVQINPIVEHFPLPFNLIPYFSCWESLLIGVNFQIGPENHIDPD